MINSSISSSHFYYVFFIDSTIVKTADSLFSIFEQKFEVEKVKSKDFTLYHAQIELDKAYGSEVLLKNNRSRNKNDTQYYWYDIYLGRFQIRGNYYYFVCYPYRQLAKLFSSGFNNKAWNIKYYQAGVDKVLLYMKTRGERDLLQVEKKGLNVDITKYSAEIVEGGGPNAKKVNLLGENPLNSTIFEKLTDIEGVKFKTISLRLKCSFKELCGIELSCDRLGNYRFWIKKNQQNEATALLPLIFDFLLNMEATQLSTFITTTTLLEDE